MPIFRGVFTYNKSLKIVLSLGFIVLFTSVGIQPAIATIKHNDNNKEFIGVTTEFIGLNKKNTINITIEQAKELDIFLKNLCLKLEKAESIEERINIYNKGLLKLIRFGIIQDKNFILAQKLITVRYKKSWSQPLLMDDNENKFCLVIGKTSNTIIDGIPFRFFAILADKTGLGIIHLFLYPFIILTDFIDDYRPILLDAYIYWGAANEGARGYGWVWTLGINGIKSWNGTIKGQIQTVSTYFTGIVGFSGINIKIDNIERTNFFLGFARHVKISYA